MKAMGTFLHSCARVTHSSEISLGGLVVFITVNTAWQCFCNGRLRIVGGCARPTSGSGRLSTTVFYKPKPRYAKPEVTSSLLSTTTFESTDQIRDAAFKEWLAKRDNQFKRHVSQQTMKEKELEEQKAKVFAQKLVCFAERQE